MAIHNFCHDEGSLCIKDRSPKVDNLSKFYYFKKVII